MTRIRVGRVDRPSWARTQRPSFFQSIASRVHRIIPHCPPRWVAFTTLAYYCAIGKNVVLVWSCIIYRFGHMPFSSSLRPYRCKVTFTKCFFFPLLMGQTDETSCRANNQLCACFTCQRACTRRKCALAICLIRRGRFSMWWSLLDAGGVGFLLSEFPSSATVNVFICCSILRQSDRVNDGEPLPSVWGSSILGGEKEESREGGKRV